MSVSDTLKKIMQRRCNQNRNTNYSLQINWSDLFSKSYKSPLHATIHRQIRTLQQMKGYTDKSLCFGNFVAAGPLNVNHEAGRFRPAASIVTNDKFPHTHTWRLMLVTGKMVTLYLKGSCILNCKKNREHWRQPQNKWLTMQPAYEQRNTLSAIFSQILTCTEENFYF